MLGVWRNSLTAISYSSRTKLHIWLEHGFNLALFRTASRNKARAKPCGLLVCRFVTELHRLSCQIFLISSFHKNRGKKCCLPLKQVSFKQIIWISITTTESMMYLVFCLAILEQTGSIFRLIYHLQKYLLWTVYLRKKKKKSHMQSLAQLCSDFDFQLLVLFVKKATESHKSIIIIAVRKLWFYF